MENVVTTLFGVESEAYQAFSELRVAPSGPGYALAEAALVKNDGGRVVLLDAIGVVEDQTNDTAWGIVIGSIVGILGGPIGVLLGAGAGGLIGNAIDTDDAIDSASALEVIAGKIYEGEIAIVALVQEEEPAFDAAYSKYGDTVIIRQDASVVAAEAERAREVEAQIAREAREELREEKKADRKERREEKKAAVKARVDSVVDQIGGAAADIHSTITNAE